MVKQIPKDQLIMGMHAIQEMLRASPRKLLRLFIEAKQRSDGRKTKILQQCEQLKIPISLSSFDALTRMVESDSHQSIVAQIAPREFFTPKDFFRMRREKSFVLMLDQIFDPQNFGAILRSAECFGVDAVIFSKNRGAEITPIVSKTSCGASELIPLIRVSNLAEAVTQFQDEGFDVVATLLDEKAEKLPNFRFQEKTVLILGSEGEGIQPLIQKRANRAVYIPMQGKIQSLNVAQSCATILYAALSSKI